MTLKLWGITIKLNKTKELTFYTLSQRWLEYKKPNIADNTYLNLERSLELYIYPKIRDKNLFLIKRNELLEIPIELQKRGLTNVPRRVLYTIRSVLKFGVMFEYLEKNTLSDISIKDVLGDLKENHFPTITDNEQIAKLLRDIDSYHGHYHVKMGLRILPYLFVRSSNLRFMEWSEIDFDKKEWIIPAKKMKTRVAFTFPLPYQAVSILKEIEKFQKDNKIETPYVFSNRLCSTPSSNTFIRAFRRMGYTSKEFVPHGFRSMFSTVAYREANNPNGHNYTGEVIEACLAHVESNKIKSAYNRGDYEEAKRGLVQWYADFLDKITYL
jgi:integrase